MDKDTLRLFSSYNIETNKRMNAHISGLDSEAWERQFKACFSSIRSLCNHIYIADFNWLKRFSGLRQFDYIRQDLFRKDILFSESAFGQIDDYLTKRAGLDKLIDDFISEINEGDLKSDLSYKDSRGTGHSKNFGGLVLHMFNHQTHHRGMISVYLEGLDIENDFCSLTSVL